jgi:hypothetical protein
MPSLRKLDIQRIDFRQTFCDRARVTLVLYRRRDFTTKLEVRRGDVARVRYSRQKEAARGCDGRGLWKFNRFSPGNRCQKRDSAKTLLLMLIDVVVLALFKVEGDYPRLESFQKRVPKTRQVPEV